MSKYSNRRSTIGSTIGDGGGGRRDDGRPPPQDEYDDVMVGDVRRMDDGEAYPTTSSSGANCCTWKVASIFLLLVAASLVVTWKVVPFEDIVDDYIPTFDEPTNPYTGPEAPAPPADGEITDGDDDGGANDDAAIGTYVPSFMTCPNDGSLCCNGSSDNCVLPVSEMMFGLVHNAMSSEEKGFIVGYNHRLGIEKALTAGYRGLSLDVCNCNGELQFCHNICDLGERVPSEVLTTTVEFLNDYPSEVVVLLFEASIEKGPIVWNDLGNAMAGVDGFSDMIYAHTNGDAWPTMGDLVQSNQRIIIFYMNGGSCTDGVCPSGFHYFYDHAHETQYQSSSLDDLSNYTYSCEITRGPGDDAQFPPSLFAVNNFVTPPDEEASTIANSRESLTARLTQCANINSDRPNFVYLDFWSSGDTAQWIQSANIQRGQELAGVASS